MMRARSLAAWLIGKSVSGALNGLVVGEAIAFFELMGDGGVGPRPD